MSTYGFTCRSTLCNTNIYASKFVAVSIFMIFVNRSLNSPQNLFLLARKTFLAITPPKQMQFSLVYQQYMPQPYIFICYITKARPHPKAVHFKLCSITPVATAVHVILRSFIVLTWMCDTMELVQLVTLKNNTKCNFLMVWCGPLHLAFPG